MFYNMALGDMIPVGEDEMLAPTKTADFLESESLRYLLPAVCGTTNVATTRFVCRGSSGTSL